MQRLTAENYNPPDPLRPLPSPPSKPQIHSHRLISCFWLSLPLIWRDALYLRLPPPSFPEVQTALRIYQGEEQAVFEQTSMCTYRPRRSSAAHTSDKRYPAVVVGREKVLYWLLTVSFTHVRYK